MTWLRVRAGVCVALLAVASVFLTLGIISAAEPGPNARAIERVMDVQDRHTARLMALPDVVGTATGLDAAGQPVVKVFLAQAGVAGIPGKLDGVPVVVEVTGAFFALPKGGNPDKGGKPPGNGGGETVDRTARFDRPVPIGVSTGHPDITAGTIGCRVTDGTNVFALSNNHVYANANQAVIGDKVLQPGTYDGGVDPTDAIGSLIHFEPIIFGGSTPNFIDAAIAACNLDVTTGEPFVGTGTPSDGYGTPSSQTSNASIGLRVKKYGRTTGETKGRVSAVNGTFFVNYGDPGIALFVGQIVVTGGNFSAGGDSGSLVVTQSGNHPVGLLFAGSFSDTLCNPIGEVLTTFGVTVDGN